MNVKFFISFYFIFFVITVSFSNEAIGIMHSFDGKLVHKYNGKIKKLKEGDVIYKMSKIDYDKGEKRGNFTILTLSGKTDINNIPFQDFEVFPKMNDIIIEYFQTALCGSVIKKGNNENEVFEWDMKIGNLTEKDILQKKMKLVFSPTICSYDEKEYIPLVFKLKKNSNITSIKYLVYQEGNNLLEGSGEFKKETGNLIFYFDCIDYVPFVNYNVICNISLGTGKNIEYKFTYKILDSESTISIENEIENVTRKYKNETVKTMIKASYYEKYKMYTQKMNLLSVKNIF